MGKENLKIKMEHFIKDNFKKENYMEKLLQLISIIYTKVNGKMVLKMELVRVNGIMKIKNYKLYTWESIKMIKNMGLGNINGETKKFSKVDGRKGKKKKQEY